VDVIRVTTMVMPIKRSRRGRKYYMRSPEWKKAIVTLPEGQTIPLFNV
jgi:ribosomal protein L23